MLPARRLQSPTSAAQGCGYCHTRDARRSIAPRIEASESMTKPFGQE
jgi:hypothetical protein